MLDRSQPVAQIVLDHSECAAVFQRHRIDFCCRGDMSVASAAQERGVDVDKLVDELGRAIAERSGVAQGDPRELSTPRLVAHIVAKHHEYLRKTLPFVRQLAAKVAHVHGDHNPKLRDLDVAVAELSDTLVPHLDDEENVLFPTLTASEAEPAKAQKLLGEMAAEHLEVAKLLERIRAASEEFTLPDWACNSYRTLFSEMRQVESDIFTHVHIENHVLKPRFMPQ
jgi:regulator of cell morphogenesis and NO signaling